MTFLLLLIAVVLAQTLGPMPAVQRDGWVVGWWRWLDTQPWLQSSPAVARIVALLGPVLALALVLALAGGWLFGLAGIAVSLLVLLYSFGRDDINVLVRSYHDDLGRNDVQAAWHSAADLDPGHGENAAESWPQLHDQTLQLVNYRYFERFFPVIFWFLVLGAPGALLYRLASLALNFHRENNDQSDADSHLLWVLEWIPLRLLGLVFALVGNFTATMQPWRDTLLCSISSTPEVLWRLIRGAMDTGSAASPHQGALELDALAALYSRALVLFLAMIALVTILV